MKMKDLEKKTGRLQHSKNGDLRELWDTSSGRHVFRALNRFKQLLRFIRFDDKETRPERRAIDKLAAVREV